MFEITGTQFLLDDQAAVDVIDRFTGVRDLGADLADALDADVSLA